MKEKVSWKVFVYAALIVGSLFGYTFHYIDKSIEASIRYTESLSQQNRLRFDLLREDVQVLNIQIEKLNDSLTKHVIEHKR